jgi:hypothetical protein
MIGVGIFLLVCILAVGNLYLHLHTLPERMAHKTHKLQFEIVAVLGLLALFTHNHLFWVIGLMLALIDLPDFLTPLRSIAGSVGRIADDAPARPADALADEGRPAATIASEARPARAVVAAEPAAKVDTTKGKVSPASREVPSHV